MRPSRRTMHASHLTWHVHTHARRYKQELTTGLRDSMHANVTNKIGVISGRTFLAFQKRNKEILLDVVGCCFFGGLTATPSIGIPLARVQWACGRPLRSQLSPKGDTLIATWNAEMASQPGNQQMDRTNSSEALI